MEASLSSLGAVCDRAAARLYDRSPDREGLIDIATVLQLLGARLRRELSAHRACSGDTRRLLAADMALAAIHRRLFWLQRGGACAPDDVLRRDLDATLRLLAGVLSILDASTSAVSS